MSRHPAALLCVAVLLLAGCGAAPPTATDSTTTISVSNADDDPYRVTLSVAEEPFAGVAVTYENGSTRRLGATNVSSVPGAALANATTLRPVGDDVWTETVRLGPGEGFGTTQATPPGATVVYAVMRLDPSPSMRAHGASSCAPAANRTAFELTVAEGGSIDAGVTCTD